MTCPRRHRNQVLFIRCWAERKWSTGKGQSGHPEDLSSSPASGRWLTREFSRLVTLLFVTCLSPLCLSPELGPLRRQWTSLPPLSQGRGAANGFHFLSCPFLRPVPVLGRTLTLGWGTSSWDGGMYTCLTKLKLELTSK